MGQPPAQPRSCPVCFQRGPLCRCGLPTPAEVQEAIERRMPASRVLTEPRLQDNGLWFTLVAVTPWGPLCTMEFGISRADN